MLFRSNNFKIQVNVDVNSEFHTFNSIKSITTDNKLRCLVACNRNETCLTVTYNGNKESLHPVLLSAELHKQLVTIHPFIDGNGRTSRLLMNLVLLQNGYPIAILKGDTPSRLQYYAALETAQTNKDDQPFLELIAANVKDTLERILKVVSI